MDKGTFSNIVSAGVFGLGLILPSGQVREFVLAIGLLAFSGGITNSLAVKMLFDRIPGLIGSGVIPNRFREIRAKVKEVILEHFFGEAYLRKFFAEASRDTDWSKYLKHPRGEGDPLLRLGPNGLPLSGTSFPGMPFTGLIARRWDSLTAPDVVGPLIEEQTERLMDSSVGGLLLMLGPEGIKPPVQQFVAGLLGSMKVKFLEAAAKVEGEGNVKVEIDEERVVADLQRNVEILLERKLKELEAPAVKKMMEDVIRSHLGWLVVWGNVLGAALGLPAYFLFR